MQMSEPQLIEDYEQIMLQYQENDEWDLPSCMFIRWDDPDAKGAILVIPSEDPKQFLQMLLDGGIEMAQAVMRGVGQVPDDMPIASIALINEAWGVQPDTTSKTDMGRVERGEVRISELDSRIEIRVILAVTADKGVYFGEQDRGGEFGWISRTDRGEVPDGTLPRLIYPLVTGERWEQREDVQALKTSVKGANSVDGLY